MKIDRWIRIAELGIIVVLVIWFLVIGRNPPNETISAGEIARVMMELEQTKAALESLPTYTLYPTYTPYPTLEPIIVVATATVTPIPDAFVELIGSGDYVGENIDMPKCFKAVFSWSTEGHDLMIAYLIHVSTKERTLLMSEFGPTEGEMVQPLLGGTYFFDVSGPVEGWTIRGECQD